MASVVGIGGFFFRSPDPARASRWYAEVLGAPVGPGGIVFRAPGSSVLAPFPAETAYFGPSGQGAMVNLRVDDLDGVLARARAAGAEVDPKVEDHSYGRFGWVVDCDGNRVELWQPAGD